MTATKEPDTTEPEPETDTKEPEPAKTEEPAKSVFHILFPSFIFDFFKKKKVAKKVEEGVAKEGVKVEEGVAKKGENGEGVKVGGYISSSATYTKRRRKGHRGKTWRIAKAKSKAKSKTKSKAKSKMKPKTKSKSKTKSKRRNNKSKNKKK